MLCVCQAFSETHHGFLEGAITAASLDIYPAKAALASTCADQQHAEEMS